MAYCSTENAPTVAIFSHHVYRCDPKRPLPKCFGKLHIRVNTNFRKCTLFCYMHPKQVHFLHNKTSKASNWYSRPQTSNKTSSRQSVCCPPHSATTREPSKTTLQPFPNQETVVLHPLILEVKV